ncbi:MAG: hypothetical protein ACMV1D_08595 [Macromonas sp.]
MNAQPQFTGTRFHPRPLRYTQAPATPAEQQYAQAISRTVRHSRVVRGTVLAAAIGMFVMAALVGYGPDDVTTAQLAAEDVAEAQANAVEMHREAIALAQLVGSKQ